ncbi:MAG: M23 family metallopeptidase, partial [Draconibacterium sp.]|nr:M23 family metallopeptidase [Draconibacterium sp.]
MRRCIFYLFLFISVLSYGQERYYSNPVKIPMLLSGSFAELRSNHFHSGIDIKTQGTTGIPIFAVADGYISRIAVSPTGFGKALYIKHPNGTTSVYAHLLKFQPEVENYVKNRQYEEKSYKVDLHLPSFLFPIKKDDEIAKSGNSGSSGGPHLHFEIRDTHTQEPLNPLKYNFPITDNIPPKIFSVLVVPLDEKSHVNFGTVQRSYPVVFYDGKYQLKNNPT